MLEKMLGLVGFPFDHRGIPIKISLQMFRLYHRDKQKYHKDMTQMCPKQMKNDQINDQSR